jgi:NitT/TauT family transport system substrate-binding protein
MPMTPTSTPARVKVGTLPFMSNAILKIAEVEGFFAEQGLEVELVSLRSSNDFMPLLLKGELDAATPALTAGFFNAVARDGKVRVALPLTAFSRQACPVVAMLARKSDVESGKYAGPAQWKGAAIGIPLAGAQGLPGYVVDLFLRQAGLTVQDVTLTPLDPAVQGEALRSRQVNLLYAAEPWITRLTASGDLVVLAHAEAVAPDLTASFIAFGPGLLEKPEVGRRFAAAYLNAVRRYRAGKTPRNVEIVADYADLEPALVQQVCWSDIPADGVVNPDSIMAYQKWLQESGLLDRLVAADEFVAAGLVQAAK